MKNSIVALVVAVAGAVAACAQAPQDPDAAQHGVARLSLFQGNVSIRHGDAGEATAAAVNAPLVATDRVVTGDGRAEVQFDAFNMIRLGTLQRGSLERASIQALPSPDRGGHHVTSVCCATTTRKWRSARPRFHCGRNARARTA